MKSAKVLRDEAEANLTPNSSAEQRRIWKKAPVHEKDEGLELKCTFKDIEQFLGIIRLMGIVKVPHMLIYWETATRYPPVVDTMYMKDKPRKWRIRIFKRGGASCIAYDFEVYSGKGTIVGCDRGYGADMVLRLVEHLPKNTNFKTFFDNFYSSFHLVENLQQIFQKNLSKIFQQMGKKSVGTVRIERMRKVKLPPLQADQKIKNARRRRVDWRVEQHSSIVVTKWYDKKPVHLISSYAGPDPTDKYKR
ncbi:hypothetical protein QYM36_000757 [Artemia franciscana]|uniref:PiggyBac transposable element-derived protein domain-containing protein n=1 Tax=Artemia franciscana TaxID=6661 RepID=A0AA88LLD9_ARTSF|nr:hypothetical protein QYM36_000757 [Artemia franciscana]